MFQNREIDVSSMTDEAHRLRRRRRRSRIQRRTITGVSDLHFDSRDPNSPKFQYPGTEERPRSYSFTEYERDVRVI